MTPAGDGADGPSTPSDGGTDALDRYPDPDAAADASLLVGFYGDDFTGSTDVLEALALNGVRTVLFLERPDAADLASFDDLQAVGVAGTARSMAPAAMDEALPPVFSALDDLDPAVVQYKVCSTFDSAPEVGSIGHAADLAQERFASPVVPVVVSAPQLSPRGRYVVFGNLFAVVDGTPHRLDRHPTMSDHPVTPMGESDLRRHLGEQTDRPVALFDLLQVDGVDDDEVLRRFDAAVDREGELVVVDALDVEHQRKVGRAVWAAARRQRADAGSPLFAVGSSGLDYALAEHWRAAGLVAGERSASPLPAADRVVVMSGSASPATADQIAHAEALGYESIRLDTAALVDPAAAADERAAAAEAARAALADGRSVVLYAARGPDDPAIEATRERFAALDVEGTLARRLGREQGRVLRDVLADSGVRRVCVAGGDTSGHVAPALDVFALEYAAPVGPGSPLCRAHARSGTFDGLEVALKGGQVETTHGDPDYFEVVRRGGVDPAAAGLVRNS